MWIVPFCFAWLDDGGCGSFGGSRFSLPSRSSSATNRCWHSWRWEFFWGFALTPDSVCVTSCSTCVRVMRGRLLTLKTDKIISFRLSSRTVLPVGLMIWTGDIFILKSEARIVKYKNACGAFGDDEERQLQRELLTLCNINITSIKHSKTQILACVMRIIVAFMWFYCSRLNEILISVKQ